MASPTSGKRLALAAIAICVAGAAALLWYGKTGRDGREAAGRTDPGNVEMVARGQAIYARDCAACHGKRLEGQTPDWRQRLPDGSFPAPPHDASGHTWHHPDDVLFEITKYGRLRSLPASTVSNMPAFDAKLSDAEIWGVLSFIKSRWPAEVRKRHDVLNRRYREGR